jgi:hypothetical protein
MARFRKEHPSPEVEKQEPDNVEPISEEEAREDLPENAKLLLEDVGKNPISAVTERYERIGLNSYQGNKAKDWLVAEGLVSASNVSTGKGRVRSLALTAKGKSVLGFLGSNIVASARGGPGHEYLKKKLAEEYRRNGWEVVAEYPIGGGKTVDLACFKDGRKVALEIETGKSSAGSNVKKCLEAGFDEVRSVMAKSRPID